MKLSLVWNKESLRKFKEHVESNEISLDEFMKIYRKESKPVGDRNGYIFYTESCGPDNLGSYRIVYSVEWALSVDFTQKVKCKHLSISCSGVDVKSLNKTVVEEIARELGFQALGSKNQRIMLIQEDLIPNLDIREILEVQKYEKN